MASQPSLPRGDIPLSGTARVGVLTIPRPGAPNELALHIVMEARSPADLSGAFCPTARGFTVPLHLAEALADEIRGVARRAAEAQTWAP